MCWNRTIKDIDATKPRCLVNIVCLPFLFCSSVLDFGLQSVSEYEWREISIVDCAKKKDSVSKMLPIVIVLVFLVVVGAAFYYYSSQQKGGEASSSTDKDVEDKKKASVATTPDGKTVRIQVDDLVDIFSRLSPTCGIYDILYAVITSAEIVSAVTQSLDEIDVIRQKKLKKKEEEQAKKKEDVVSFDDLFDQDGFDEGDEDEDDDEATKEAKRKAKEEEAQKKADMERLKQATGQALPVLEDMDDGVLGQMWVEKTLQEKDAWPLDLPDWLKKEKFDWKGKKMSAMEHPAVRRILCMTAGRMNSAMLNSHDELLQAGQKKMIDQTYFKGSMEFRQRVGILLEACLRVALTLQSYRMFGTLVETIAVFKIGCQPDALPWFNGIMARQYNTLPRIAVGNKSIESADESNKEIIVAGGEALMSMAVDRTHREQFVRAKVAQAQKQGLPPQVALQASREGWWFLLRCERLDGPTPKTEPMKVELSPILQKLKPETLSAFKAEPDEFKLQTAWPMMVQNIAQKAGTVKVKVKAPTEPGKYRYTCAIKSQDFLGVDQEAVPQSRGPWHQREQQLPKLDKAVNHLETDA